MIIAIDGPSGSGKTTIAGEVAARLGFSYLDTGAMFRVIALKALRNGIPLDNDEQLGALARETSISFQYSYGNPYPSGVLGA